MAPAAPAEATTFVPPKASATPVELPKTYNHEEDSEETYEQAYEETTAAPVVKKTAAYEAGKAAATAVAQGTAQSGSLAEQIARMRQLTSKK